MISEHYVVTIDVKKSVRVPASTPGRLASEKDMAKAERMVEDVTHLVFRSSSLDDALSQARKHLNLMAADHIDEQEGTS
jgi:hypothetical protein